MSIEKENDDIQITSTIEDYLEGILMLSEEKGFAQVTELANLLQISKASVTEMVSKLRDILLVNFQKYGTISLTEKGIKIAKNIKERHDIILSFLLLIDISEDVASIDCCVMEHNLSKETVTKLKEFIAFLEDEKQNDVLSRFKEYRKSKK